jgi:uncharacterized caspase-like protein
MRFFSLTPIAKLLAPAALSQGLGLLMLVIALLPSQALAARVALVIGNAAYAEGPLRNPVNDARAMDQKLTSLGFKVQRIENMKRQQIGRTLSGLVSTIKAGDEVVVFYAGHGLQVKGVNYLPVVDADIQSEDDVPLNSLNLNALMDRLDEAKAGLKLLFLDACRNNPYARIFRGGDRGLARVGAAPSGTLIHFATRPGSVAADGTGANGLYTTQLLRHMDMPNVPVETMLKRVSVAVEAESKGAQEPWTEGSIRGDFYFKAGPGVQLASVQAEPVADAQSPRTPEADAWDAAQRANTSGGYTAYLSEYPSGRFAAAARVARAGVAPTASGATPAQAAVPPAKSGDAETQLWNEVKARGTRDYLDAYFKQYPRGKYLALAKLEVQRINDDEKALLARAKAEQLQAIERERQEAVKREQSDWNAVKAENKSASYRRYLDRYQQGRYVEQAQEGLQKALAAEIEVKRDDEAWVSAKQADTKEAYTHYVQNNPNGKYLTLAAAALQRFVDRGNGIVRDSRTGLEWTQKELGRGWYFWNHASAACANRSGNWRLPSKDEYLGLLECNGSACKAPTLFQLGGALFWSADQDGDSKAWFVDFSNGQASPYRMDMLTLAALCVRKSVVGTVAALPTSLDLPSGAPVERGMIGVSFDGRAGMGMVVQSVLAGQPAQRAGISAGDIVVMFEGVRVKSNVDFSDLIQSTRPGTRVAVGVIHGTDGFREFFVTVAAAPAN